MHVRLQRTATKSQWLWILVIWSCVAGVSHAQLHKCIAANGVVSYSDKPCSAESKRAPEPNTPKIEIASRDQLLCAVFWHSEMRKFVDALGLGFAGDKIIWNGREVELKYERVPIQTMIDFALCRHAGIKRPASLEDFITNSWNAYQLMCTLGDRKRQEELAQAMGIWNIDRGRALQITRQVLTACTDFLASHSSLNAARKYFRSQYVETLPPSLVEVTRVMPKGQGGVGMNESSPAQAAQPAPAPFPNPALR